ncbi:MAG TPA: hypothetical protein VN222_00625 [Novosphingobium sp.]|nr:hypothetical protein [Novosphingobium sp.]
MTTPAQFSRNLTLLAFAPIAFGLLLIAATSLMAWVSPAPADAGLSPQARLDRAMAVRTALAEPADARLASDAPGFRAGR